MTISRRCQLALAAIAVGTALATACSTSSSEGPAIVASASNTGSTARPATSRSGPGASTTATVEPDLTGSTARNRSTDPGDEPGDEPDPTSTDGSTGGVALPAACELITGDDAEDALGEPVQAGEQRMDECWWSSANDLKTVNIIRRRDDVETWRQGYQNDKWEAVDLGDEGYAGKVLDSISFRLGTTTYEVNVVYSTEGDPQRVVKDLTTLVVARL